MEKEKSGEVSYVLVVDVTDNGMPYYYTGYYNKEVPINTQDYVEAMKIPFRDECQNLCDNLNEKQKYFQYHVEEHMYM